MPKIDPPCGDIIYTENLLQSPPEGVTYENYADALERGALVEHGRASSLRAALKAKRGIGRELFLLAFQKTTGLLRKKGLFFWEPFRFFSVRDNEYDLIHCHVFSVKFFGSPPPLAVSNAAPLPYLYSEARNYPAAKVKRMEKLDIGLARLLKLNHNSFFLPTAARVLPMTGYLKQWYVERHIKTEKDVDVVPIFLNSRSPRQTSSLPKRIGFVAKDFEAKGGPTVLEAVEIVRRTRPDVELFIIGCPPQLSEEEAAARNITWLNYVEREKLIGELMPSFDVFAYPTRFDGQPLVVLEAMSCGIPIATSDYQAMPEIIGHGKAGLVSPMGNAASLANNLLCLLEPTYNKSMSEGAYAHFQATYAADVVRPHLRDSYEATLTAK